MGHTGANRIPSADAEVEQSIHELLEAPRQYLERRKAEELRDIQDETRRRQAAAVAQRHSRSTGGRKVMALVRKALDNG
jgi:hypothetical protein